MSDEVKGVVEFSEVVDVAIREDGEEVKLTCKGDDGLLFDMLIPVDAVVPLSKRLLEIGRSARISKMASRPVIFRQPQFTTPPPLFLVTGLSGVVYPESGQIDLQITPMRGPDIQLSLPAENAKALFDLLLQVYNLDDQKPS
jgi:hypothetical protein